MTALLKELQTKLPEKDEAFERFRNKSKSKPVPSTPSSAVPGTPSVPVQSASTPTTPMIKAPSPAPPAPSSAPLMETPVAVKEE
jgi:hypothetical protein